MNIHQNSKVPTLKKKSKEKKCLTIAARKHMSADKDVNSQISICI